MPRFNNDQVSTIIWFASGGVIAWGSVGYGLGSLASPGSGFITFLAGLGICFFSFIGLVEATLRQKKGGRWKPLMKGLDWGKAFLVMGALTAYTLLLSRLGFIICTASLCGVHVEGREAPGVARGHCRGGPGCSGDLRDL